MTIARDTAFYWLAAVANFDFFVWVFFLCLRSGVAGKRLTLTRRNENPISYWAIMSLYVVLAVGLLPALVWVWKMFLNL